MKLRSVNTEFWKDTFVEKLNVPEKLIFLYLITNPETNLLGIYEISIKRIAFETGVSEKVIEEALKKFKHEKKIYYIDNYIILVNWLKHQNLNKNMKVAIVKEFNNLPINLKNKILGNDSEKVGERLGNDSEKVGERLGNDSEKVGERLGNDSGTVTEWFGMIKEQLGKIEIEIEIEDENENENENESKNYLLAFDEFRKLYPGTKRGLRTEFDNFVKKHKDWKEILPVLKERLEYQIKARQIREERKLFVPEWKNLRTWINQRCWEEKINIDS